MHHLRLSSGALQAIRKSSSRHAWRFYSSASENKENFEIPNYIQRSPTAILKALSQTVGYDPTAPHFKYHDDPYLTPMSNVGKRSFALAMESGRKSAKWIRQEHSKLFQHKEADPPIEAFIPTKIYTIESEVDLSDLTRSIDSCHVDDAILIYGLLKEKGIDVPRDLQHSFLEMIAFYNCEEPLDEEWIEERWFRQSQRLKERPRKTWKDNDTAEQVFYEIEPKEPRTYSAIIRGMCKYYQVDKAYAIFNDCLEKNIELDTECFNSIISVAGVLKESADLRWKLILDMFTLMKEKGLNPNLGTMNACLSVISQMGTKNAKLYALQIFAEFKKIGIVPSLGSYCYILNTFCSDRGPVSHVLHDIMKEIENKEFEIRDVKDTYFFMTAMEIARHHLFDPNLAKRINALLHKGENYNLIGDSYRESAYYRNYFSLLVQTEPFETFMNDYYHYLVPHVYIPEPSVVEDILKALESNNAIEHVPQIWSHMICFDQITRENLINILVRIMLDTKPSGNAEKLQNTNDTFGKIAWDIWTKIEERNQNRSKPIVWTGKLLGDLLRLVVRTQDIENSTVLMEKLWLDQQKILGEPEFAAMDEYVQLCIQKKEPSKAINCLQYCTEITFDESKDLAKKIYSGFTLDENHLKKVAFYVGQDVLEDIQKEQEEKARHILK